MFDFLSSKFVTDFGRQKPEAPWPVAPKRAKVEVETNVNDDSLEATDWTPSWSPLKNKVSLPKPLNDLFCEEFFQELDRVPLSLSALRELNERIAMLERRGLAPAWMPKVKLGVHDLPHLVGLAIVNGAAGAIDLAEIIAPMSKIVRKISKTVTTVCEKIWERHGEGGQKTNLLAAAAGLTGLFSGEHFFFYIIDDACNQHPEVEFLLDWITADLSESALRKEAHKILSNPYETGAHKNSTCKFLFPKNFRELSDLNDTYCEYYHKWASDCKTYGISVGKYRLKPPEKLFSMVEYVTCKNPELALRPFKLLNAALREQEALIEEIEDKRKATMAQDALTRVHANIDVGKTPVRPTPTRIDRPTPTLAWLPEKTQDEVKTPAGVILTGRAIKEIRRCKEMADERLETGLRLLGLYREMRMGEISKDDYHEAVQKQRFEDTLCFSDRGSLKTFESDYSVVENGKRHTLDRHLKWGRGNNATTSMRIYYAWDVHSQTVIVGSAPRHLPVWNS